MLSNPSTDLLKMYTIEIKGNDMYITFPLKYIEHISFEDVKRILWAIIGKDQMNVTFDKNMNILLVKVHKNKKSILTLKKWYDNMNSTEEHK